MGLERTGYGVWGAAALALVLAACGGGQGNGEGAGSGNGNGAGAAVTAGMKEFRRNCALCHGVNAEGMPRLGTDLHENEYVRGRTDEELLAFLQQGRPADHPDNSLGVTMPPRGGNPALTDAQLLEIIAFVRSIQ